MSIPANPSFGYAQQMFVVTHGHLNNHPMSSDPNSASQLPASHPPAEQVPPPGYPYNATHAHLIGHPMGGN